MDWYSREVKEHRGEFIQFHPSYADDDLTIFHEYHQLYVRPV